MEMIIIYISVSHAYHEYIYEYYNYTLYTLTIEIIIWEIEH